jgi:hypothetical protein
MLIILEDKILSERQVDAVISAEMPDAAADPELHDLVATHMLHPRCDINTQCSCRRDAHGVMCPCVRHYPKQMIRETVIVQDGYPMYRRRGRFQATCRDGIVVSDDWVVPHNAYLLRRYRCHVNLEVCSSFRCFKYVYKYTFKPPDHTSVSVSRKFMVGKLRQFGFVISPRMWTKLELLMLMIIIMDPELLYMGIRQKDSKNERDQNR